MIDQDELTVELKEKGINVNITENNQLVTVELTNSSNNGIIGVAKDTTVERALSTVIRRLVDDSTHLKEHVNVLKFEGLSRL